MAKFDLLTTLTLNASGYNKGIDGAKAKTQQLGKGVQTMSQGMKKTFSGMVGMVNPMLGQLNVMSGGVGKVIGGFKSMIPAIKGVRVAIMSTGIGAIILAITAAVSGLISWMKRTDEGSQTMRKAMNAITAVIEVVLDRLALLGGSLVKLFKGDFKGAWEDIKGVFTGVGDAIGDNIKKTDELSKKQRELEIFNVDYATKKAKLEVDISELQLKSREKEKYNEQERLNFVNEHRTKLKELHQLNYNQLQLEVDIEKTKQSLGYSDFEDRKKLNEIESQQIILKKEYNDKYRETLKVGNQLYGVVKRINQIELEQSLGNPFESLEKVGIKPIKVNFKFPTGKEIRDSIPTPTTEDIDMWKTFGEQITSSDFILQSFAKGINAVSDSLVSLAENGQTSFKSMVTGMLDSLRSLVNALLATALAGLMKGEAVKGLPGLVAAAAGIPILLGMWKRFVPEFEWGGIANGTSYAGDNQIIAVNRGEMILNRAQQSNLFSMLRNGNAVSGAGEVRFEIEGTKLVGVLANYNRNLNSYR